MVCVCLQTFGSMFENKKVSNYVLASFNFIGQIYNSFAEMV